MEQLLIIALAHFLALISPGPDFFLVARTSISSGWRTASGACLGIAVANGAFIAMAFTGLSILREGSTLFIALQLAGAAYLLYLAWQAVKPGARSPFEARDLPQDSPRKLFVMGFLTNLLNPKIAVFYLAIFPQFVSPGHGSVFAQSLLLGVTQIGVSFSVNLCIVMFAARLARWSR